MGGPGVSYWVSANPGVPPQDDRASATDLVQLAVNESLPLDFVSFHDVSDCTDPSSCSVLEVGRLGKVARAAVCLSRLQAIQQLSVNETVPPDCGFRTCSSQLSAGALSIRPCPHGRGMQHAELVACGAHLPRQQSSIHHALGLQSGGEPTFVIRAQFARYALTQPVAVLDGGRFNTTEIHCTEYYPGVIGCAPFQASMAGRLLSGSLETCLLGSASSR